MTWKRLFNIFILCSLLAVTFTQIIGIASNSDYDLKAINEIDKVIWGDLSYLNNDRVNYFIKKYNTPDPDLSFIKDFTSQWVIPMSKVENKNNFITPVSDLKYDLRKQNSKDLYVQITYEADKQRVNFVLPEYKFNLDKYSLKTDNVLIYYFENASPDSIIQINQDYIDLTSYKNDFFIRLSELENLKVRKYNPSSDNLLGNQSSFEFGLWQNEPFDCSNKLPGKPQFESRLNNDKTHGEKSLLLSSSNHYACVNNEFSLKLDSEKLYRFSFDYKNLAGNLVQYYYKLQTDELEDIVNENNVTVKQPKGYQKSETIPASSNNWETYFTTIKPQDNNVTSLLFYLYSPSDGKSTVTNLYDNLRLQEYSASADPELAKVTDPNPNILLSNNIVLINRSNEFSYDNPKTNLLGKYSSFEEGMWAEKPETCSNYLPGDPILEMSLNNEAKDGKQSLKLGSKNHYACTSRRFKVPLRNDLAYKLSFQYKNLSGRRVGYYYNLVSSNTEEKRDQNDKIINLNQSESKIEMLDAKPGEWTYKEVIIEPSIQNIQSIDINLYSPSEGDAEVVNLFDDLKLEEFSPKDITNYYLESKVDLPKKQVNYEVSNQSLFTESIKIESDSNHSVIYSPTKFDADNQLYTLSSQSILNKLPLGYLFLSKPRNLHAFEMNGYGSGWEVELNCINNCNTEGKSKFEGEFLVVNTNKIFLDILTLIVILLALGLIIYRSRNKVSFSHSKKHIARN